MLCTGCVNKVKNLVTGMIKGTSAIVQGAREYIPANCSKYGDPYVAPWSVPDFNSTPDYNSGHSGATGTSYNPFNIQLEIPQGMNSEDLEGHAVATQLKPSDLTSIKTMKDSFDAFNE